MPAKGTRTGAAIFEGVAEAVSRASDAHAPKAAAVRDKALTAFMERGERELAGPLRGIMDELLASEALPDHYRAIFERVSSPERQFDFLYDVAAVLSFVLSAAFAVGQPLVQGVLNEIWARHPSMPLRPQDAAEGWLRGAMDSGEAEAEALASGTDLRRFRILQELAGNPPGPQELLEMWRRDIIGDSKLERGIRQSRLRNEWTEELKALATRLLDVQAVLEGVRRGLVTRGEAERELRGHGFSAQGVEVLLAPESGSSVGGLVNVTPSLSDFIRFAGREVFEPDQRAALGIDDEFPAQMATFATQLGISERFARDYWAAHWDIPSVQQGIEMLHRRVISRADLEGLFRAAEIPTIWRDRFVRIAFAPYTRVDLRRLRQQGLITHEQVIEGYMDLGYDADKAAVLTEFAELDAGAEERALAKGEVINLFGAELIDRDTAQQLLEATGLAPHWAAMRLDLAQSQKAQQAQDRRINVVRSRYLAFKATRTEAAAALDGVAVPFETREALIAEWDALREATTRDLSEAQLAEALRREIITESEYVTRLVEQGYTTRDAEILSGIRGAQRAARGGGAA